MNKYINRLLASLTFSLALVSPSTGFRAALARTRALGSILHNTAALQEVAAGISIKAASLRHESPIYLKKLMGNGSKTAPNGNATLTNEERVDRINASLVCSTFEVGYLKDVLELEQ